MKMQKKIVLLLVLVLVAGLSLSAKEAVVGENLKMKKTTMVSEILEKPETFLGKPIRVEGYVVDGCHHRGNWLGIASDKEFQSIEVWDKEGKMIFPLDHKGKYAIVEGTLYGKKLTEEEASKWLKHLNANHKRKVDVSKAKGGMTLYRIDPVAVVLKDSK
ncbi:MAG: hypothetical protein GY765_18225 [bacterium]|nr:hypothetical protein [bacterium]